MDFETARDLAYEYFECLPETYVSELRPLPAWVQQKAIPLDDIAVSKTKIKLEAVPGIDGWVAAYYVELNRLFLSRRIFCTIEGEK